MHSYGQRSCPVVHLVCGKGLQVEYTRSRTEKQGHLMSRCKSLLHGKGLICTGLAHTVPTLREGLQSNRTCKAPASQISYT